MFRIAVVVLIVVPAAFAILPSAAACHAGAWADGPQERREVLGAGTTGVGVYVRDRAWQEDAAAGSNGCEGQSWAQRCAGVGGETTVGPVIVPEIRVLGMPVLSETEIPPMTVPHGIPRSASDTSLSCATPPAHLGVYVEGAANVQEGTDTLLP